MKGIRKNAVMLPLPRKSRFECAYFILKRGEARETEGEDSPAGMEMLAEAGRILRDNGLLERSLSQKRRRRLLCQKLLAGILLFFGGTGLGMLLGVLLAR